MGLGEAAQSAFLRLHQKIYEGTGGRLGHRMTGVPTLLLRTTGRKTGQPRTAALVYAQDGDSYIVVASKGGSDQPPGWLHNVTAQPDVQVQVGTRTRPARAEPLTPADPDYARLWRLVNAKNHDRYDAYQRKTTRPIALVRLTPSG
jgi:deazaflavin-dependent oxidoreductase (nitroreductase family)